MLEDFGAELIINRLHCAGFEAYYVGGCVRNYLLNRAIDDYDLTTSASPEQMCEIFSDLNCYKTGIAHGTLSIIVNDKVYEVTTFRVDGEYADSRHPISVNYCSTIKEDLARRDFTINAIAFNKKSGFIDDFNGIYDIDNRIIRCVGNPSRRFSEDALRILRALRFASVYSFSIEPETSKALLKNLHLLKNISQERITAEITKIILGENALPVLSEYRSVLLAVIPHLDNISISNTALAVLNNCPFNVELRYAALLFQCGRAADEILTLFKLSNKQKRKINLLLSHHGYKISDKIHVKLLLAIFEKEICDFFDFETAVAIADNDDVRVNEINQARGFLSEILLNQECYSLRQLAVSGSDLLALGFSGKEINDKLHFLLDAVIKCRVNNDKTSLLRLLEE